MESGRALYGEDNYVGYRFYEKTETAPLFPFGHGLSYITFSSSDLTLRSSPENPKVEDDETVTAFLIVANTGPVAGAEVVQLWIVLLDISA